MLATLAVSHWPQAAKACGPYDPSYHFFNLFVPEWVLSEEYSPAFYTSNPFWSNIWGEQDYSDDNLAEWQAFFKNEVNNEALLRVLKGSYSETYGDMSRDGLINYHLFRESKLPAGQVEASKRYLLLALDIEQLADVQRNWWDYNPDTLNTEQSNSLIGRIETALQQEKFPFLKERYAFQLVKSLRYANQLQKALEAYQTYFGKSQSKSIIRYWALDHIAGIELQQGKDGQAYYHFLTVFKECRSRRSSAYYSFNITSEADWQATYALCQTPDDKALMHFLRGARDEALGLHDMEQVFGLLGNHEWLRALMAREINKLESANFEYYSERPIEQLLKNLDENGTLLLNQEQADYAGQLLRFTNTLYYNYRDDPFWALAKAYLEFLNGQFNTANLTLHQAGQMTGAFDKAKREIALAILILKKEDFSPEEEDHIAREIIEVFEDEDVQFFTERNNEEFILDLLAHRARQRGEDLLAAFFARESIWMMQDNPSHPAVDALIDFIRRPQHSQLELLALKHYMGGSQKWLAFNMNLANELKAFENQALDIKGTLLMRDPAKLADALAIFESLPPDFDFTIDVNPFNMSINDCIHPEDCNLKTSATYTRNALVRKLIEMKGIAEQTNSSTDYYLLGNAYYNMTYFGPAWKAMNYFRSGSQYAGFYDCAQALAFYEKAVRYAPDRESAARACFMAAKAEQNLFFKSMSEKERNPDDYWWGKYEIAGWGDEQEYTQYQQDIRNSGYRKYFEKLRQEYKDTKYYQRAVKECKYFEYYTTRM